MIPRSHCAICTADCTGREHALTREQGRALGIDADTAAVCLGCLRRIYARAERDRRDGTCLDAEVSL